MSSLRSTAAWSLILAALCAIAPAHAAGGLHRCQTADGLSVYTDSACAAVNARPAPMSVDLLTRLEMDRAVFGGGVIDTRVSSTAIRVRRAPQDGCARNPAQLSADLLGAVFGGGVIDTRVSSTAIRVRRAPQDGCARNPAQLSADLLGAFAMGDVNRIAESVHWPGLRHQQAHVVMQRLQMLARQSLVDASFWPGLGIAGAGAMQLTFAQPQQHVMELGVEHYAGCYFVRF